MDRRTYGGGEAARILGIPYWTLYSWDRSGLAKPSFRTGEGQGARRHYDFRDLVAIRALVCLRAQRVPTQRIRRAVRELQRSGVPLERARLYVLDRQRDVFVAEGEDWLTALSGQVGQRVPKSLVIVELGPEAERVQKAIRKVRRGKRGVQERAA